MTDLLWALARPPKPTFFRSWPTAVAPRWRVSTACWRPAAAGTWCDRFVRLWLAPTRCVSHCARGIAASVRLLARPSAGADEQGWRPAMRDNASSPLALAASQGWRMRRPRAKGTQEIRGPFANGAARDRCPLQTCQPRSCCAVQGICPAGEDARRARKAGVAASPVWLLQK